MSMASVYTFTVALSNPILPQMTESDFFLFPNCVKPSLVLADFVF